MHESLLAFGEAAQCKTLEEAAAFIRSSAGRSSARRAGVAAGMVIAAVRQAELTVDAGYREDTLKLLDALGAAKAELDSAAVHDPDLTRLTTASLSAAQKYAWEMTIPCTEWPSPREVAEVATREAREIMSGV